MTAPTDTPLKKTAQPRHRLRVPGFLVETEQGLGDVIRSATYRMGLRPCAPCQARAEVLNRWLSLSPRRPR